MRYVQVVAYNCRRGFESHFWHSLFLLSIKTLFNFYIVTMLAWTKSKITINFHHHLTWHETIVYLVTYNFKMCCTVQCVIFLQSWLIDWLIDWLFDRSMINHLSVDRPFFYRYSHSAGLKTLYETIGWEEARWDYQWSHSVTSTNHFIDPIFSRCPNFLNDPQNR